MEILFGEGAEEPLLVAALFHQMIPTLEVNMIGQRKDITNRTSGAVTGSRVAGQLGRVPVLDCLKKMKREFDTHG